MPLAVQSSHHRTIAAELIWGGGIVRGVIVRTT